MCGIFGLIDTKGNTSVDFKKAILKVIAFGNEDRGVHAGGIAYLMNGVVHNYKNKGAITTNGTFENVDFNARAFLGHTRFTTHGSADKNENNHPFMSKDNSYAMAHNGVLYNHTELQNNEKLDKPLGIETDSYVITQLIDTNIGKLDLDSLVKEVEKIEGSFNFTFLDNEKLVLVENDNPLSILTLSNGIIVYSSEKKVLQELIMDIEDVKTEQELFKKALSGETALYYNFDTITEGNIWSYDMNGNRTELTYTPKEYTYTYTRTWESYKNPSTSLDNYYLDSYYDTYYGSNYPTDSEQVEVDRLSLKVKDGAIHERKDFESVFDLLTVERVPELLIYTRNELTSVDLGNDPDVVEDYDNAYIVKEDDLLNFTSLHRVATLYNSTLRTRETNTKVSNAYRTLYQKDNNLQQQQYSLANKAEMLMCSDVMYDLGDSQGIVFDQTAQLIKALQFSLLMEYDNDPVVVGTKTQTIFNALFSSSMDYYTLALSLLGAIVNNSIILNDLNTALLTYEDVNSNGTDSDSYDSCKAHKYC